MGEGSASTPHPTDVVETLHCPLPQGERAHRRAPASRRGCKGFSRDLPHPSAAARRGRGAERARRVLEPVDGPRAVVGADPRFSHPRCARRTDRRRHRHARCQARGRDPPARPALLLARAIAAGAARAARRAAGRRQDRDPDASALRPLRKLRATPECAHHGATSRADGRSGPDGAGGAADRRQEPVLRSRRRCGAGRSIMGTRGAG